jgi:hypothetical protein
MGDLVKRLRTYSGRTIHAEAADCIVELETQLKAANDHQREWGRLWSDLIKLEAQLEGMGNAYDELNDGRKIWIARALRAEKQLAEVRGLKGFSVPYAPLGEKAVWVSDIEAIVGDNDER